MSISKEEEKVDYPKPPNLSDFNLTLTERALSAAGAAIIPAVPLNVAKVGIYLPCYDLLRNYLEDFTQQHALNLTPYSPLVAGSAACVLACITCYPIELARTLMQAFKDVEAGVKPPGVWKTLLGEVSNIASRRLEN